MLAFVAIALCTASARAEPAEQEYVLDLPASRMISFQIEFAVPHPGPLAIVADWDNTRVLSFKLEGANGAASVRRSGPPPQRLKIEVDPSMAASTALWKLSISGLPGVAAKGTVRFSIPQPEPLVKPEDQAPPPPVAVVPDPPWLLPRQPPADATGEVTQLYDTTERLRSLVASERGSARDRYGWQEQLLAYLASRRDGTATMPDPLTLELLKRTVEVTRGVDRLSTSTDPLIAGPPPPEAQRRKAWMLLRSERIRSVESELDLLLYDVTRRDPRNGAAPEWLPRFVSSLMACERYFEQRGRLGIDKAAHAEVVAEQWDGLRLAADALDSLVQVGATD